MNILLAFKAEPDAGMLAEKEWQAAAQGKSGPDISLLRSLLGADEQAAAALLLAQRKNGTPMSFDGKQTLRTLEGNEQVISQGPAAAMKFALALVRFFKGEKAGEELEADLLL